MIVTLQHAIRGVLEILLSGGTNALGRECVTRVPLVLVNTQAEVCPI